MVTVTYVEHDGTEHVVNAALGQSMMQAAVDNLVPAISADCGGACRCATCLCHVEEAWLPKLDAPSEDERLMLEAALDSRPNSRLSCQIKLQAALDGIRVQLPEV